MGRLVYLFNASADGYVETPDHSPDWSVVDDELHTWCNEQMRGLDATIYGRRLYEVTAAYWPTAEDDTNATDAMREFARIWNPLPKIVFSTLRLLVHPVALGAGTPYFPPLDTPLRRRLHETHLFSSGVVYLAYAVDR